jgi:hypothetical protein
MVSRRFGETASGSMQAKLTKNMKSGGSSFIHLPFVVYFISMLLATHVIIPRVEPFVNNGHFLIEFTKLNVVAAFEWVL